MRRGVCPVAGAVEGEGETEEERRGEDRASLTEVTGDKRRRIREERRLASGAPARKGIQSAQAPAEDENPPRALEPPPETPLPPLQKLANRFYSAGMSPSISSRSPRRNEGDPPPSRGLSSGRFRGVSSRAFELSQPKDTDDVIYNEP